ncbi:major type 1 subunit fimbrin (pilin) [Izhakiella capsodis]|uniref:Major type 1 subunit fimbrin (Pilin) n=1 Tax=Izhakiella capsodis TaxID=1367852 RepID=A0A1I4X2X0_9GAMM|nr:type 1 fimbrial major subunit FimA [Izhakiella capsodis]SFN19710.1 major type 1 subunit fimbrin (pilin) [Izhakiella capsodis]
MRKIRFINTLIAASVMTASLAHAETTPVTVNGGTVHFKGEVVNAACAVDAGSIDQTVQLGQVKSTTLSAVGKTSSAVGFNIQLDDCDTTVATKASIAFSGVTVNAENPTALALEGSSEGVATNVGVQVLDSAGKALAFNGTDYSTAATLFDGNNTLPFQARYIATGAATPGAANANANFKVQYQ